MGNPYNLAISRYQNPQFKAAIKADPAGQLAKMIGISDLRREIDQAGDNAIIAMCGVILYRHLDRFQQRDVLQRIQDLINNGYRALGGRLRGLIAMNIAQPQWNVWSLNGKEVLQLAKSNKNLMEVIDRLGLHTELKLNAMNLAGAFYLTAKLGPKGAIADITGTKLAQEMAGKYLSSTAAKGAGWVFALVYGLGTVMYELSDIDYKRSEKERDLRTGAIK